MQRLPATERERQLRRRPVDARPAAKDFLLKPIHKPLVRSHNSSVINDLDDAVYARPRANPHRPTSGQTNNKLVSPARETWPSLRDNFPSLWLGGSRREAQGKHARGLGKPILGASDAPPCRRNRPQRRKPMHRGVLWRSPSLARPAAFRGFGRAREAPSRRLTGFSLFQVLRRTQRLLRF